MKSRSSYVPAALAAAMALVPAAALANGRFPAADMVVIGPGASDRVILVRNTFGVVYSDDGGGCFHYFCEAALGISAVDTFDPAVWIGGDGALLVGSQDTNLNRFVDRCAPTEVTSLNVNGLSDLTADPTGHSVFAAVSVAAGSLGAQVAGSSDNGQSFQLLGSPIPNKLFHTLDVAPSDSRVLYGTLGPVTSSSASVELWRSGDGGNTWAATGASFGMAEDAFVAGIDPTNADVVYVRAVMPNTPGGGDDAGTVDAGGDTRPSTLFRWDNAAGTVMPLTQTAGPMLGFAISDDGHTLWVGGNDPRDGLSRSDDGGAFARVNDAPISCLRYHAGALYVCEPARQSPTLLARSLDRGATLTPVLQYRDLPPPPECPPNSPTGMANTTCNGSWATLVNRSFGGSTDGGGVRCDAGARDAAVDGGNNPPEQPGCHCRVGRAGSAGSGSQRRSWFAALAAALIATTARARRRRRSPTS